MLTDGSAMFATRGAHNLRFNTWSSLKQSSPQSWRERFAAIIEVEGPLLAPREVRLINAIETEGSFLSLEV